MEPKTRRETLVLLHDEAQEATLSMEASIRTLEEMDQETVLEQKKKVSMRWDTETMSPKEVEEILTVTVATRLKEMLGTQTMNLAKLKMLKEMILEEDQKK